MLPRNACRSWLYRLGRSMRPMPWRPGHWGTDGVVRNAKYQKLRYLFGVDYHPTDALRSKSFVLKAPNGCSLGYWAFDPSQLTPWTPWWAESSKHPAWSNQPTDWYSWHMVWPLLHRSTLLREFACINFETLLIFKKHMSFLKLDALCFLYLFTLPFCFAGGLELVRVRPG